MIFPLNSVVKDINETAKKLNEDLENKQMISSVEDVFQC